jgi:hypothetical protein
MTMVCEEFYDTLMTANRNERFDTQIEPGWLGVQR